jgi:hypothetical protein
MCKEKCGGSLNLAYVKGLRIELGLFGLQGFESGVLNERL